MPQVVQPGMRQRDLWSILVVGRLVVGLDRLGHELAHGVGVDRLTEPSREDVPGIDP